MRWIIPVALASLTIAQDDRSTEAQGIPILPLYGKVYVYTTRLEPVEKEMLVGPNDRLGTRTGDVARFSTEGGLVVGIKGVKVGKDTGLGLSREGGRLVLKLFEGSLVVESYESDIQIKTRHGTLEGKQVYFLVEATAKATRVVALEGRLTFTRDLGGVTIIEEGTAMELTAKTERKVEPTGFDWASAAEEPNLLPNPGFEEGLKEWNTSGLEVQLEIDSRISHSGRRSCKRVISSLPANQPLFPDQVVKGRLKAGSKYMLRFFVRTEKYVCNDQPGKLKLMLDLTGVARPGWPDTSHHYSLLASEGVWASRKVVFEAAGPDLAFGMGTAVAEGTYSGTLWFDDFALKEIPRTPKGK